MIRRRTLALAAPDWAFLRTNGSGWATVTTVDVDQTALSLVQRIEHKQRDGSVRVEITDDTALAIAGSSAPLDLVRIVGPETLAVLSPKSGDDLNVFSRHLPIIGEAGQRVLHNMHVGVVGYGGTGSAAFEQLVRLGVGTIVVVEPDTLEDTNVTRVHGAGLRDVGTPKVDLAVAHAATIGLGTTVVPIHGSVLQQRVAAALRGCDAIFCCTDDHAGRGILSRLSYRYLIPLFDNGVSVRVIDSEITGITGRVVVSGPGLPCLHCVGQVDPALAAAELLQPADRARRAADGYAPGLEGPTPSVGAYTTAIASLMVIEFIHRLIGFGGLLADQLVVFDRQRINRPTHQSVPGHYCVDPAYVGAGECTPFLDTTWAT